jgi:8-oxo-dGTP pyrophosphatase MutT (NUDIX family)
MNEILDIIYYPTSTIKYRDYVEQKAPVTARCSGFAVLCEEHVLLVCTHKGIWGFPKGKHNKGETHIDGGYRELEEETGLKRHQINAIDIETFYLHEVTDKGVESVRLYLGTTDKLIPPKIQDEEELQECRWVKVDDAHKLLTLKNRKGILMNAVNYRNSKN